jgi:LuxR family maltose regulon positive regulatory protein
MTNDHLTRTEIEVLRAYAKWGTAAATAAATGKSVHTVTTQLRSIHRKTGLSHSSQLVAWAARVGLLDGLDQSYPD